jgi:replicative DNA helicase
MAVQTDYSLERGLPASPEAERSILGGILVDGEKAYHEVAAMLMPEHLSLDSHRRIYMAMRELGERGEPIDMITLADELNRSKWVEAVGGVAYVSGLIDGVPERPSLAHYVEIVREKAMLRGVINVAQSAVSEAFDPSNEADQVISRTEEALFRLRGIGEGAAAVRIWDAMNETINEIKAIRERGRELVGLPTGITGLDESTTGIRDDEYWVVGALPARGKTVLGVQITATNAGQGVPVLFFSHEMTRRQLCRRILPWEARIPSYKIRTPTLLTETEIKYLTNVASKVAQWPMWIVDPDELTAQDLCAIARLYIRRNGVKLIVVDYLQLVQAPGRDPKERVTYASNILRAIPKKENVPVVALSQMARPKDGNENSRPSMIQLRETGYIEAHAHVILLLYRPKQDSNWTGDDEIIIAKQREGMVGVEPVVLHRDYLRFQERTGHGL